MGETSPPFVPTSTRSPEELTVNENMGRGLTNFSLGLSRTFSNMAEALKPGAPLAFTYHHNRLDAYLPLAIAILDAGLVCSASLPCPAEMSASIHINGTGSSIIDTVFVCRSTGSVPRFWLADGAAGIAELVASDLEQLKKGGVSPSRGDTRCITYGHLLRLVVWHLRGYWDRELSIDDRLARVRQTAVNIATPEAVEAYLDARGKVRTGQLEMHISEAAESYDPDDSELVQF